MMAMLSKLWKCPICLHRALLVHGTIRHLVEIVDERGKSHRLDIPALEVYQCGKCKTPIFTELTDVAILQEYKKYLKGKNVTYNQSA